MIFLLLASTVLVAYANGANDNFKGVATLYGSNTLTFKKALLLGTVATFTGCLCSAFLAESLVKAFSGRGLVPDVIATSPEFLTAVGFGAALTVLLATAFGFPISTTHALTGALAGAGFVAAGPALNLSALGLTFFLPLLLGPVLSILLTVPTYRLAHWARQRAGITTETCVCVGPRQFVPVTQLAFDCSKNTCIPTSMVPGLDLTVWKADECVKKYDGTLFGITAQGGLDMLHLASGAAVSFARGLNDMPKLVGLLVVMRAIDIHLSAFVLAIAMALGGLLSARRVAETMSRKIATMNDGQALAANLVTAFLVIFASRLGLPVSTTHVSVGAITGIGLVNGSARTNVVSSIVLSWLLTLPLAAALAATLVWALQNGA